MANQEKNRPVPQHGRGSKPEENDANLVDEDLSTLDQEVDQNVKSASTEDSPADFVIVDTNHEEDEHVPLSSEATGDFIEVGTNSDEMMDAIEEFTDDEDVRDDFAERQEFATGRDDLLEKLLQHHSRSPDLSADDVDASWETANQAGEETVGGSVPTPDQDIVDELGEAVGITYDDDEPLQTDEKLGRRDQARWELDPASADDELTDNDEDNEDAELDDDLLEDLDNLEEESADDEDDELVLDDELEDAADLEDLTELDELDDLDDELDELEDDWEDLDDEDWDDLDED